MHRWSDACAVAGLDPAIHPLSKMLVLKMDGYAGSSSAKTRFALLRL